MSGEKWSLDVREHHSLGIIYLPGFTASQDTNLWLVLLIYLGLLVFTAKFCFNETIFPITPSQKTFEALFSYYRSIVQRCKYCTRLKRYCTDTFPSELQNVMVMAFLFYPSTMKTPVHNLHWVLFSCTLSYSTNAKHINM